MAPWRIVHAAVVATALFSGLFGVAAFLYYWDPTRVLVMRWRAPDAYRFEKINPRFLKVDPASLIRARTEADAHRIRRALVTTLWGADRLPFEKQPARIVRDVAADPELSRCEHPQGEKRWARTLACNLGLYTGIDNLAAIDRVWVEVYKDYIPSFVHFRPKRGNGRLIIYHHGYAGTYHDQHRHIATWLNRGYAVMAFNLFGYGENHFVHTWSYYDRPMRVFFEPVVVAVNYAKARFAYRTIDTVGLSAGGWVTAVVASLDPRIRRSYPVAGVYPVYLRKDNEFVKPQLYPPMLKAANYLDMFVLAAWGEGRGQLQVFNRYDKCCYNNLRGKLYEAAVQKALARVGRGRFAVLIDETHARHKISAFAMKRILADMERP